MLEACYCLKLLSVYFDLCVHATGVVCHQFGLLGIDLHAVGSGRFVEILKKLSEGIVDHKTTGSPLSDPNAQSRPETTAAGHPIRTFRQTRRWPKVDRLTYTLK